MFRRPFGYSVATPWREMERLRREMNRLFEDSTAVYSGGRTAPSYPAINVWTNEEGAVITAELAGVSPDQIDISVVGDTLTLTGTRQVDELPEGARYHRRERSFGQFSRTFQLPFNVEVEKVDAVFRNGILHLSLPRAEVDKPKKITVKSA